MESTSLTRSRASINTNHVYAAFDEQIGRCREWLRARLRDACDYSAGMLTDRLTQRIVEIGLAPYATFVHERLKTANDFLPPPASRIDFGRGVMHVDSGRLAVPARELLRSEIEFLVHWMYWALAIVRGAFSRKDARPASLVVDMTDDNLFSGGSDSRFVDYCRSGSIGPLRAGKRFLIKSDTKIISSEPTVYSYCSHPLMELLCEACFGSGGRVRLLVRHLALFLRYHVAIVRTPVLSLISKEFACSSVSRELDERGLIESVVVTCSSCGCQPLWLRSLRRAQVHMIWYSQNWRPLSYVSDGLKSDWPALRWIRVDAHWVWTKAFAGYLAGLGHGSARIEVVGPIVWSRPRLRPRTDQAIKILVFDVPAVSDQVMVEIVGEISNYYHPRNLRSFASDIVALKPLLEETFQLPVSVWMKMKRGMRPHYAAEYFQHVEAMFEGGVLRRPETDDDLFSMVSGSHLVIAYPFTSPAYLAEWLGVPCIYYDPTRCALRDDFFDSESMVRFARGADELKSAALELLNESKKRHPVIPPWPVQAGRTAVSEDRVHA